MTACDSQIWSILGWAINWSCHWAVIFAQFEKCWKIDSRARSHWSTKIDMDSLKTFNIWVKWSEAEIMRHTVWNKRAAQRINSIDAEEIESKWSYFPKERYSTATKWQSRNVYWWRSHFSRCPSFVSTSCLCCKENLRRTWYKSCFLTWALFAPTLIIWNAQDDETS